jgi:hypothetical protein
MGLRKICLLLLNLCLVAPLALFAGDLPDDWEGAFEGNPGSCSMCHTNFEIVMLKSKTKHLDANVNCITCHGQSFGHIENEINEVKPNRVIDETMMVSFCTGCHTGSIHPSKQFDTMVCTKCHDAHGTVVPQ